MDGNKQYKRPNNYPASLDGIRSGNRILGTPARSNYLPNRGQPAPTLGGLVKRGDGFHSSRPHARTFGVSPEIAEAEALLDEPIILDDQDHVKDPKRHIGRKRSAFKRVLKMTFLTILATGIAVGGFLGWKLQHSASKIFHGNLLGVLHTTKLKGEDQGRVNILIAGNSADDPGHDGADLTDSIMLVSFDTVHNNGYLLSIPRDLWVDYGTSNCSVGNQGKINAVYECGQQTKFQEDGFPDGGMGLLEKNIEQDFGININYYSLIDYSALKDAVGSVGGINVTINSPDPRGIYDPSVDYATHGPLVKLTNGVHVLNGQQALDLARARGDSYNSYGFPQADFNRTQNQRQMLLALKDKALSVGVLSNPAKVSSLLDAVGNNVHTDFQTSEVRRLYDLSKKIPNSSVQSVGFADKDAKLLSSANYNGQSSLIPAAGKDNYYQIQAFIKRLNSNDPLAKEDASVEVLNGTKVDGLAAKSAYSLTAKGLNVKGVADASPHKNTIVIALNPKKTATNTFLQQNYRLTSTTDTTANPESKNYAVDFVIILGEDATATTQN